MLVPARSVPVHDDGDPPGQERAVAEQEPRPGVWPLWVRVLVLTALALLLVFGLVQVFTGGARGQQAAVRTVVSIGLAGLVAGLVRVVAAIGPGDATAGRLQRRLAAVLALVGDGTGAPGADRELLSLVDRETKVAGQLLGTGLRGESARVVLALVGAAAPRLPRSPLRRALLRCRRPAAALARRARRQQARAAR